MRAMPVILLGVIIVREKIRGEDEGFVKIRRLNEWTIVFEGNTGINNGHLNILSFLRGSIPGLLRPYSTRGIVKIPLVGLIVRVIGDAESAQDVVVPGFFDN